MEDVLLAIAALAVHISPAVVALIWATFSTVPRVKSLMTRTAMIGGLIVMSLFLFGYSAEALCDGSALKGFVRCEFIPVSVASLVLPVYLLSMGLLAVWVLVVILICGWAEIAKIRERNGMR